VKRVRRLAAATVLLLAGCDFWPAEYDGPDPPRFVAPKAATQPPRLALVLSGGGPRGFAHVGVLRALEEAGIRPDLVVGSSAGALVGALYAAGRSAADVERLALDLEPARLIDFIWYRGRVRGRALQEFVERVLARPRIEEFPMRFAAIATRVHDQRTTIFNAGAPGAALRASAATQSGWIGRFLPVRIGEATYVDGDESSPLPARAARTLGARRVLAVDVSVHMDRRPAGAEKYREGDEARRRLIEAERSFADVVIHPDLGYWAGTSRQYRERVIEIGYREAVRQMAEIRRKID